jgi:hypothetical protein
VPWTPYGEPKSVRTSGSLPRGLAFRLRHLLDRDTGYNEGGSLRIVGQVLDFALADGKMQAGKFEVGGARHFHSGGYTIPSIQRSGGQGGASNNANPLLPARRPDARYRLPLSSGDIVSARLSGYHTSSSRPGDTRRSYNAQDCAQLLGKMEGTPWTKSNHSHRLRRAGRRPHS